MKNEVDLIKELWQENSELTEEELDKNFDEGFDLMREIAKSQNTKLLPDLLELFTDRNEDYGGVCETLDNDIWDNYEPTQIVEALKQNKFKYLLDNDLLRACTMAIALINTGYGNELRELFNKQRSENSKKFLDDLTNWGCKGNYENYTSILREDMKKW